MAQDGMVLNPFFNKQMVCDECYERCCMFSDTISVVPCIAGANHFIANEAIVRSIEDQFDSSVPESALPSVLLNIFDDVMGSIWSTDYYLEAQKASCKCRGWGSGLCSGRGTVIVPGNRRRRGHLQEQIPWMMKTRLAKASASWTLQQR